MQNVETKIEQEAPANRTIDPDKKILYIDDTPANINLVEAILSTASDMNLMSASNARDGIEMALMEAPHLILMDIHMPEMDGLEAFGKLRADEKTRGIPVIALTANAMEEDIQKALDIGFKGYITKPINVSDFMKTLNDALV